MEKLSIAMCVKFFLKKKLDLKIQKTLIYALFLRLRILSFFLNKNSAKPIILKMVIKGVWKWAYFLGCKKKNISMFAYMRKTFGQDSKDSILFPFLLFPSLRNRIATKFLEMLSLCCLHFDVLWTYFCWIQWPTCYRVREYSD